MKLYELQKEDLVKKIKLKNLLLLIAILILIIFGIIIYISQYPSGGQNFGNPLDENVAVNNSNKVRTWPHSNQNSSKGVYYDSAKIRVYLDTIYHQIKDNLMKGKPIPKDCVWKVGFYWMMSLDPKTKNTRRDFCVLPVLIDTIKGKVYDYFDEASNPKIYNHSPIQFEPLKGYTLPSGSGNPYDNGQMWP